LKYRLLALACAFASTAAAQLGNYLGPGILTRGAGDVGTRSGQEVDLRFYAAVTGIYDNGLQPISVDSKGNLVQTGALEGAEAQIGAYGVHRWRASQLGLDYHGTFRYYPNNSYYDGSDHTLVLGYTAQKSKRLYFDVNGVGGTVSQFLGYVPGLAVPLSSTVNDPTLLLFDNRTDFVEAAAAATYLLTSRTSFTAGGQGFFIRRQSSLLVGLNGYELRGSLQHRVTRRTSIGAAYEHTHYDYPRAFGQADINAYRGVLGVQLSRRWTFSLRAGVYQLQVQGLQQVAVDPVITALLGVTATIETFYAQRLFPAGEAHLTRTFRNSLLSFDYSRGITPGNGVYLTSRQENAGASFSYTGIRKFNMGVTGGETSLSSVGQSALQPYRQITGGAGVTYALTPAIHIVSRFDARHQAIDLFGYRRTSERVTIGLAFSPGNVPLSLW
jgi:hypothetical protein